MGHAGRILQAHQLTTRLRPDELRAVLPRKPLRPRTYRLPAGATIHLGALARVDVVDCPGATMYLTVWASADVVCHFGKMDKAEALYAQHAGGLLQPPVRLDSPLTNLSLSPKPTSDSPLSTVPSLEVGYELSLMKMSSRLVCALPWSNDCTSAGGYATWQ